MQVVWKSKSVIAQETRGISVVNKACLVALCILVGMPSAVTRIWNGGGADNNWSTAANWGGTVPATGDSLVFAGNTRLAPYNDLTNGTSFLAITFNAGAGAFVLSGNSVQLSRGIGAVSSNVTSGSMTINNNITFYNAAPSVIAGVGGALVLGGVLDYGSFGLTISSAGNTTLNGVVQGTGTLTKSGNGNLTLSGTNTFTGSTSVSAGILILNNTAALGSVTGGVSISTGAAMDLNGLNYSAAEALTLNGLGPGNIGALINTSPTGATYGGLITLGSATSIVGGAGSITISNTGSITGNFPLTLGGALGGDLVSIWGGTGSLTKVGTGTWMLSGANTHTSQTIVSGGILRLNNGSALGTAASGTTVDTGAALDLNGVNYILAESLTVNGVGPGSIGALINSSATGATFAGLMTLGGSSSIIGQSGSITLSNAGSISGAGFDLTLGGTSGGTLSSIVGTATGNLIKVGSGAWTLGGVNTYAGATTISAGTLKLGTSGSIPDGSVLTVNGTLDMNGYSEVVGSLSGSGTVGNSSGVGTYILTAGGNNTNTTYTGVFVNATGKVSLAKAGTGTLTLSGGVSTFGYIDVQGGSLSIGGGTYNLDSWMGNSQSLNASGGTFNMTAGTIVSAGFILYGLNTNMGGTISGGSITANELRVGWNGSPTVSITGGTHSFSTGISHIDTGTGILTLSGGAVTAPLVELASNSAGSDGFRVELNSGSSITATKFGLNSTAASGTHTMEVNLKGGTIQSNATGNLFDTPTGGGVNQIFTVKAFTGGAAINTGSFTSTIKHPIGHDAALGATRDGGITKLGTGTLVLEVANGYTGPTVVSAGTLKLGAAGVINSASAVTANGTLELNGFSQTIGSLAGSGIVDNNAGTGTINLTLGGDSTNTTFSGVIQNTTQSVALTKTGTGTLILSGANTYTGGTSLNAGNLDIGNGSTSGILPGNCVSATGTMVRFFRSDNLTYTGVISGLGVMVKDGAGTLFMTGNNTFSGTTTINDGGIYVGNNGASGALAGNVEFGAVNTPFLTFHRTDDVTFGNVIGGSNANASVVKWGPNILTLSGANTYGGSTIVNEGSLKLGNATALGATGGGTSVAAGATLDLNGLSYTSTEALTVNGSGVLANGALINSSATAATYAGLITLGSASSIKGGTGTIALTNIGTITGAAFDLTLGGAAGGTLTGILGTTSGALTKADAGTWTLSGANTYTGETTVSAGTLKLDNTSALGATAAGTTVASGATLDLNGLTYSSSEALTLSGTGVGTNGALINSSASAATYAGSITLGAASSIVGGTGSINLSNAGTITGATFGLTLAGAIGGTLTGVLGTTSGFLSKEGTGTWTLSGANTYSGSTVISAGTLVLGAAGVIPDASAVTVNGTLNLNGFSETIGSLAGGSGGVIDNNSGTGTFTLTAGGDNSSTTFAGILQNTTQSVAFTKAGTGILTLSGSNTHTGLTTISAGTLKLAGVTALGTTAAGTVITSGAVLDLNGTNYTSPESLILNGTGISANGALINTSATAATYGGLITLGSTSSIKGGTGTLALSNTGTITGATFGLTLGGASGGTLAGILGTTSGSLTLVDAGTWTLSAGNTYTGATTISSGTLKFGTFDIINNASPVFVDGTLDLNGFTDTLHSLAGTGFVNNGAGAGSYTLTVGAGNLATTFSGILKNTSGSLAVTKIGSAVWTLSGANEYTGITTVSAGTLKLGSTAALGTAAAGTTVASGAVLDMNGVNYAAAEALTLNGTGISALGALINSSATGAAFAGLITLGSATSIKGDAGAITVGNAGIITGGGFDLTLGGGAGGTLASILGTNTGSLSKIDAGSWMLSGANTYTGATTISAGTLKLNNAAALGTTAAGTTVVAGSVLDLNGINYTTAEPLTLNGTGISSGGALINDGGAATFAGLVTLGSASSIKGGAGLITLSHTGTITGATFDLLLGGAAGGTLNSILGTTTGGLTKSDAGSWTLSGSNTFTGTATFSAGTLKLGAAGVIPDACAVTLSGTLDMNGFSETIGSLAGTGTVDNTGGAGTFTLTAGGDNSNTTFSGVIQNTSQTIALTKEGTGVWTLSGTNTHTGLTTINAGSMKLGNTAALGSTLSGTSITSGANLDLNGINYSAAEALTLNGTGISTGGAISNSSATTATFGGLIALGSASSIIGGSGSINVTNTGTISGAALGLTLGGAQANNTFYGKLGTGSGILTKTGSGTWTLSGSNTLTVSSLTIASGILNLGSALTHSVSTTLSLSGGGLDFGSSTLEVQPATIDFSALATLSAGTGTLKFTGSAAQTFTPKAAATHPKITQSGTVSTTLAAALTADTLTVTSGIFVLGSGLTHSVSAIAASGGELSFGTSILQVSGNANLSGLTTLTPGTGTLSLTKASGTQILTPHVSAHPAILHNSAGTLQLATNALSCASFSQNAGVLDFNGRNISTTGNFGVSNGNPTTFTGLLGRTLTVGGAASFSGTSSASRLNLDPGGAWTLTVSGTLTGAHVAIDFSNATGSSFTGNCSNCNNKGGNVNWNFGVTWDGGGADANWTTANNWVSDLAPTSLDGVTFNATSLPATLDAAASVRSITFTSGYAGTFSFSSNALTITSGDADFSSGGAITAGTGSLTFSAASGTQVFTPKSGTPFPAIIHNNGGTLKLANTLTSSSFSQSAGVLDLFGFDISTTGNFTVTNGTTASFSNLDGRILTVGGATSITGTSSANRINLNPTTTWFLYSTGAATVSLATVKNSTATGYATVSCSDCGNQGTNPNWNFAVSWDGGAGDGLWTTAGNWASDFVPTADDIVTFNSTAISATLNAAVTVQSLTFTSGYTGAFSFSSNTLSVSGNADFSSGGTITAGTGTLAFIGTGSQTFIPKSGATFPNITQNGNAGTTTITTNALTAGNLTLTQGTFHLGSSSLSHTVGSISGSGALNFGNANLSATGNVDLSGATVTASTSNTLSFTGTSAQTYLPKASVTALNLAQNGTGGTTIATYDFTAPALTLAAGTLSLGSARSHAITSLSATGGGLDFGSSTLSISGTTVSLAGLGTITAGTGTLKFTGSSPQTFTPRASLTHPHIIQYGAGGTTIATNNLAAGSLTLYQGTFNLGTGLTHTFTSVSDGGGGPYGSLDFGSSQLHATGHVQLGNLTALTSGSGSLHFDNTSGSQIFVPKSAGAGHPAIFHAGTDSLKLATYDLVCAAFTQSAGTLDLSGRNLSTSGSGNFTVTNAGATAFGGLRGRLITVGGNASITGVASGNRANLDPDSAWTFAVGGTLSATFASIANNTASPAAGTCTHCANNGGNSFWTFITGWDGGGADNNWTTAANWGGDAVPSVMDDVIFDATSVKNVILDQDRSIRSLVLTSGYTGNFDFSSFRLTVTGATADFRTGGTLTAGTGTLDFGAAISQTFYPKAGHTYPNLEVSGPGGAVVSGAGIDGAGNLVISSGTFALGNGFSHLVGGVSGSGTLSFGTSELKAAGHVNLSGLTVTASGNRLTFANPGTQNFTPKTGLTTLNYGKSGAGVTTVLTNGFTTDSLLLSAGTLDLGAGLTHSVTTALGLTGGTLAFSSSTLKTQAATVDLRSLSAITPGTGALRFERTSAQTFIPHASAPLPQLVQYATGGTTTVTTNPMQSSAALTIFVGTFNLGAGLTHTVASMGGTGGSGALDFGSSTLRISSGSAYLSQVAAITPGTGTLEFTAATGTQILGPLTGYPAPAVIHSGAGTLQAGGAVTCASFTQTAGAVDLNGYNFDATGNFSITNGTTASIAGLAGRTLTVGGSATLNGTSSATKIGLNPGAAWTLAVTGALITNLANLANNTASGSAGTCGSCANGGANSNWSFATVWDGGGADTKWTTAGNWSGDVVPSASEDIVFNATSVKNALLDSSVTVNALTFASGYTGGFDFGDRQLTLTTNADFRGGQTLASTTGSRLLFSISGSAQLFPKSGTTLPDVTLATAGTLTIGPAALNAGDLTISAGIVSLATVSHTIKALSGSGTLALGGGNLAILGDANLSSLAGLTTSGGALQLATTGSNTFTPKASFTHPAIAKTGSGTVTLASNGLVTPSLTLAAGTLALGTGLTHSVTATLVVSGGTLAFGSSTLRTDATTLDMSALAGLTPGTGTLEMNNASAQAFTPAVVPYPRIVRSGSGTTTVTGNSLTVASLQLDSGTLAMGTRTLTVNGLAQVNAATLDAQSGSLVVNGALDVQNGILECPATGLFQVTGALTYVGASGWHHQNGTLTLAGATAGGNVSLAGPVYHLLINGSGSTWTLTSHLTANGDVTITAGTLDANANARHLTVLGNTLVNGGTLTGAAGRFILQGNFSQSSGIVSCPNVAGVFSVGNNFSQAGGTYTLNGGKLTLAPSGPGRSLSAVANLGDVEISGGGDLVATGPISAGNLTVAAGGIGLGSGLSHTIASFAATGGTIDFGSSTLNMTGAGADFSGLATLTAAAGKLVFTATSGSQSLTPRAGATHPRIEHTGTGTLVFTAYDLICSSFLNQAGALDFNGRNLTISAGGALDLFGAPGTILNLGGRMLTVNGNALLRGQPANRLDLAPGTPWTMAVTGTLKAVHVDLRNSLASISAGIADSSVNLNGNTNWTFVDTIKPVNVTNFQARRVGGHAVELAWTASVSSDADSVMLRYRTDGAYPANRTDGALWRNVARSATLDTATGIPDKALYRFAAFVKDSSGNYSLKAASDEDTAWLPDVTAPANVGGFTALVLGPTSTAVSWSPSPGNDVDSVMVRYRTDGTFPVGNTDGVLFKVFRTDRLSDTVTGLTGNVLYHFAAFARDSSGNWCPPAAGAQDTALYQVPILGTITVSDNLGRTKDTDPALAFTYSGADSLRFALIADTSAAAWKSLRVSDSLVLSAGADGKRVVAVQFKNIYGRISAWTFDTTVLDRQAPVVTLNVNADHSWRNWNEALSGKAFDSTVGTDSVFIIRKRLNDGAYFNGAGWSTVADTAKLRADSGFSVPMPNSAMATGQYGFTAYAKDKLGIVSAPLTKIVTYTENRAPEMAASTVPDSALQNQTVAWTLELGDLDLSDSVLTVSPALPAWLAMTEKADTAKGLYAARRVYSFTGKPGQANVASASTLTIQATDLGGKTFIYSKTIKIIDVNDPPVFAAGQDSLKAKEDSVSRFVPKYADPDPKDSHVLALLSGPAYATIEDTAIALRPGSRDVGTALIRVTVGDGKLLDTLDLAVNVANVNDAPVAFPSANWQSPAFWKEDVVDSFTVVVVDMDRLDPVTLATVLPPFLTYKTGADSSGYNRYFRFTAAPAQKDTGSYPLKLRFQDAAGAFSELPLLAKVAAVNDTPTAVIAGRRTQGGAARIALDVQDQDGNPAATRFHYRLIGAKGDTVRSGISASALLALHPLADGEYTLAIKAEDEGGLKQPAYTLSTLSITGATSLSLDSARWNMIAYPGRALPAGGLGGGAAVTSWDESAGDGSPLGRYASGKASDSLVRGKGYWVRTANRVALSAPITELLAKPFALKLARGKQGWNQIGNPYPYSVDLSATGLVFWEWDAERRDLVNSKGILKPWGAYWVQVAKDTLLTIKDEPWFAPEGAQGPLAKSGSDLQGFRHARDWTLQLALSAGPYRDASNFLGVRSGNRGIADASGAAGEGDKLSDAPKFGDYVALHFEQLASSPGLFDILTRGYAADFRTQLAADEEWWDFSIENSGTGLDRSQLSLPGLESLAAQGLYAFLVDRGAATTLTAEKPITLAMGSEATHYSLVVTPQADFATRLKGNFSISQNFPNPVRTHTQFRFNLPQTWGPDGKRQAKNYALKIRLFDFSGRQVAQIAAGRFQPGAHSLSWKPQTDAGGALSKGAYIYRLEVPGFTKSLKMMKE